MKKISYRSAYNWRSYSRSLIIFFFNIFSEPISTSWKENLEKKIAPGQSIYYFRTNSLDFFLSQHIYVVVQTQHLNWICLSPGIETVIVYWAYFPHLLSQYLNRMPNKVYNVIYHFPRFSWLKIMSLNTKSTFVGVQIN